MTVTFNKARNRWLYDFWRHGERHQGYCLDATGNPVTSKSAAKQAEGVEKRRVEIAPKLPQGNAVTLADVVADLLPSWQRQADWDNKQRAAREILDYFGATDPIVNVTTDRILRYRDFSLAQPIRVWRGAQKMPRDTPDAEKFWKDTGKTRSASTTNRRLAILRLILGHAAVMRDPLTRELILKEVPNFDDLPEPKRDARPTPDAVMERCREILPPHAVDALVITLCFGFRSGEAFSLQEPQVDWANDGVRLFHDGVKDKKDAFLPGSQFAMGYLRCLAMEADERGLRHLISYRRHPKGKGNVPWRPIKSSRKAWGNAMEVIEQEFGATWRWHDLRAAFITHIAMTAGPMAAQTLARHADFDTTRAYIKVADQMTRAAANQAAERPALRVMAGKKSP